MKPWITKSISVGMLAAAIVAGGATQASAAVVTEGAGVHQVSIDNDGVLNGNQIYAVVQVPINVCGIGVGAVIGIGAGVASCNNGAWNNVDAG
ncbi:chaplin family protein [Longispora sp. NPDC051575]|uniref:chaplin family protein n=1 Tax=Longispora sp. NPDC051575 TaxID=3154943 RepID=UPI00342CBD03